MQYQFSDGVIQTLSLLRTKGLDAALGRPFQRERERERQGERDRSLMHMPYQCASISCALSVWIGQRHSGFMVGQHPSPNVKTICNFEPQIWPEPITSCNAEGTCFKGSRTSCEVIFFWRFLVQVSARKDHIT